MTTTTVSFRLNTETYLKLEAIAADKGLSPGGYLKEKLENEAHQFIADIQLMKSEVSDISHNLNMLRDEIIKKSVGKPGDKNNDELMPLLLEILLILREVGSPQKVSKAQKLVSQKGLKPYNSL